MEELIMRFTRSAGSFCNHLESSCDALKNSVDRRPIPLDSASSTFIQSLNRRVNSVTIDINMLDSMSDTVSFEELVGHCLQIFNKNDSDLSQLEDFLKNNSAYVPEAETDNEDELSLLSPPRVLDSKTEVSAFGSVIKSLEESSLLTDESLSLKNLGLSDYCLATLASDSNGKIDIPDVSVRDQTFDDKPSNKMDPEKISASTVVENADDGKLAEDVKLQLKVSKDDYENLPSYLKALSSWEDLLIAIEKINSCLINKDKINGSNYFHQDEISSMDLGHKARTYLLLLVRMNQLVVETINGLISYKVV